MLFLHLRMHSSQLQQSWLCRIKGVPVIGISPNTETTGAAPTSPIRGGSFFLARRYGKAVHCCTAQGARLS